MKMYLWQLNLVGLVSDDSVSRHVANIIRNVGVAMEMTCREHLVNGLILSPIVVVREWVTSINFNTCR